MDDNCLIGRRLQHGVGHHGLEHRPLVVGGGSAGLDMLLDHDMTEPFGPEPHLAQLVRDGQIILGLPGRGDTGVKGDLHNCAFP